VSLTTDGSYQRIPGGERGWGWQTDVEIRAKDRQVIEKLFHVLEAQVDSAREIPDPVPAAKPDPPTVFIGHGRSIQWRMLKDHLADLHGYRVEAFETGARAGHAARDVLEEMLRKSAFALLVLTAEDEQADDTFRARQNVVHEAGLFQGRLGFCRAIVLIEDGCESFSNIEGIQHIRFSAQNIRETFGDVLATLRREFPR
jgi:predicted nucleotide-binding protein